MSQALIQEQLRLRVGEYTKEVSPLLCECVQSNVLCVVDVCTCL
jgi:hypothetical protein